MAYRIKDHTVAYVRATEEPVFVMEQTEDEVTVRRVVKTDGNALVYGFDTFKAVELYTDKDRVVNQLELLKFQSQKRNEYSEEYQRTQAKMAVSEATPQADGDSSLVN